MNKKKIAEQIHRILSEGDPINASTFDPREIELSVGENADMLMQKYLFAINKGRDVNKFTVPREFLRKVAVPITNKKGVLSGKNFPLTLVGNKTVYQVRTDDETIDGCLIRGEEMLPMVAPDGILSGLESKGMEGLYGYYLDRSTGDREVEIVLMNTGEAVINSVSAFVVPSSYGAAREDELSFPATLTYSLIKATVEEFSPNIKIPDEVKQKEINI